jgi:hypothetical protein
MKKIIINQILSENEINKVCQNQNVSLIYVSIDTLNKITTLNVKENA